MVGIIAFVFYLVLFFLGVPVGFSMGIASLFGLILMGVDIRVIAQQMVSMVEDFQMLSIPFFVIAAQIMNQGIITKRIFDFVNELVGHLRGGLAYVNIIASVIFAGISGTAVSDASGLGLIEIKAMKDAGYDEAFSAAVTAASCIVGPIIPPSIMFIIYGHLANISIAALFLGGILPGLLASLGMMVYVWCAVRSNKALAIVSHKFSFKRLLKSLKSNILILLLPPILLYAMLSGMVTPTELGVLASIISLILSFFYVGKDFICELPKILLDSAKITGNILFLLATTSALVYIITRTQTAIILCQWVLSITDNKIILLLLINLLLLIIGAIMETLPAMLIIVPLLTPIGSVLGINPVHLGVVVVFNLMIGMVTPPYGTALFVMASITNLPYERIVKAVLPFLIPLIIVLLLITYIPSISTFIPNLFSFL